MGPPVENQFQSRSFQTLIFNRKTIKVSQSKIFPDNVPVFQVDSQKHPELILDSKLTFNIRIRSIITKVNKTIDLIRKQQLVLPRLSLLTIYKAFIRPHLDYGVFDQGFNDSFHQKIETVQYDVDFAITGTIRRTSWENFSQELYFQVP